MLIVLGLSDFSTFAGTETYTLTVADELVRLGHEVTITAGTAGPIAEAARARGINVVTDPERLPASCDALIAQDTPSAFALADRYPHARRLMVVHSEYFAVQSPPQLDEVCDAVVVLNDRVRRHVEQLSWSPPIIRLRQPVDLKRFGTRGGAPKASRRALVLGNYLRAEAADAVTEACTAAGLEPVLSGIHSTPTQTAEQAIADVEVVIGLGRCIVEAMAGRRAAYVYGIAGGDGWVTPDRYAALEADGFGGTATDLTIDRARLAADLSAWHPEMGPTNRQLAHGHHDAAAHTVELVARLQELQPGDRPPPPSHAAELARLVRLEWQSWSRYAGALDENRRLRDALTRQEDESRQALADEVGRARREAEAEVGRLNDELTAARRDREVLAAEAERAVGDLAAERASWQAFRATKRFRLAAALARPFDRHRDS